MIRRMYNILCILLLFFLSLIHIHLSSASRESRACGDGYPLAALPSGYCAFTFYSNAGKPRGLFIDRDGDGAVLVVDRKNSRVLALYDTGEENGAEARMETVLTAEDIGINHGIVVEKGFLYLSSSTEVWKWKYKNGKVDGDGVRVVRDIPAGGHSTRSLVFYEGDLLVQCGSKDNVDKGPERAAIKLVPGGESTDLEWEKLEVFADGLRNTVGLKVDKRGRLWGVENGRDQLVVPGVGDVHQENPCEELNLIERGRFYGYPYTFSEYSMPRSVSRGRTGQFMQPEIVDKSVVYNGQKVTDTWLRNETNVVRPKYCMPSHWAPLGLELRSAGPAEKEGKYAFPNNTSDAIFSFSHGSWNADPAVGYLVSRIDLHGEDSVPKVEEDTEILFSHEGRGAKWEVRPVDGAFAKDGTLLFTSDSTGEVIGVRFFENLQEDTDTSSRPCFPADSVVFKNGFLPVRMDDVRERMSILTRSLSGGGQYSDVFMFGHRNVEESHEYLEVCSEDERERCLTISREHYVYSALDRLQTAGSLHPGGFLQLANGSFVKITSIRKRRKVGLYSPVTLDGSLIVDGFRVSAYSSVTNPRLAHRALAPLRLLYRLKLYELAGLGGWLHKKSRFGMLRMFGIPEGSSSFGWNNEEL